MVFTAYQDKRSTQRCVVMCNSPPVCPSSAWLNPVIPLYKYAFPSSRWVHRRLMPIGMLLNINGTHASTSTYATGNLHANQKEEVGGGGVRLVKWSLLFQLPAISFIRPDAPNFQAITKDSLHCPAHFHCQTTHAHVASLPCVCIHES